MDTGCLMALKSAHEFFSKRISKSPPTIVDSANIIELVHTSTLQSAQHERNTTLLSTRQSSLSPAREPSSHYGLLKLWPETSDSIDPTVDQHLDIIALHGIKGHRTRTWTDPVTNLLWLRDLLPESIPGIRVFSFGYAAEVVGARGSGNIASFAGELLEDIQAVSGADAEEHVTCRFCTLSGIFSDV